MNKYNISAVHFGLPFAQLSVPPCATPFDQLYAPLSAPPCATPFATPFAPLSVAPCATPFAPLSVPLCATPFDLPFDQLYALPFDSNFYELLKDEDYELNVKKFVNFVIENSPDTIILINPNNPNGGYINKEKLNFIEKTKIYLNELFICLVTNRNILFDNLLNLA